MKSRLGEATCYNDEFVPSHLGARNYNVLLAAWKHSPSCILEAQAEIWREGSGVARLQGSLVDNLYGLLSQERARTKDGFVQSVTREDIRNHPRKVWLHE